MQRTKKYKNHIFYCTGFPCTHFLSYSPQPSSLTTDQASMHTHTHTGYHGIPDRKRRSRQRKRLCQFVVVLVTIRVGLGLAPLPRQHRCHAHLRGWGRNRSSIGSGSRCWWRVVVLGLYFTSGRSYQQCGEWHGHIYLNASKHIVPWKMSTHSPAA